MRSFDAGEIKQKAGVAGTTKFDPDAALVIAVAGGDMQAAGELITRHSGRIHAIGYRMLGNNQAAEDLTQDVFFKIWKNAGKWEPGRALFSTWLHRVAINLCYDKLRKRKEVSLDAMPEAWDGKAGDSPDAFEALEEKVARGRVRAAVAKLSERQSAAITLCHFEGLTNTETAEVLETTVEAVESLLSRGRKKLRELLNEERSERTGGK